MKNIIYSPFTGDILTVGHLRYIRECQKHGELIIGLLTAKALRGYKEVINPFNERKELLEGFGVKVVPQDSLNCYDNLVKFKATHCASGDGFEPEELTAIKKAHCEPLNISLPGEKQGEKLYSTSAIKQEILKINK